MERGGERCGAGAKEEGRGERNGRREQRTAAAGGGAHGGGGGVQCLLIILLLFRERLRSVDAAGELTAMRKGYCGVATGLIRAGRVSGG